MTEQKLLHLDPAKIQADDNSRFALKSTRLDSLKASIVALGGITTPVQVEALPKPVNGFTHRLLAGFYRHQAALDLNKAEKLGITIPATLVTAADAADRLRRQLSENLDRENQSPMDEAVSIKKLLATGMGKPEIRTLYARVGGKKGTQLVPASNAWLNMRLSFLDLPKAIQTKIHDGRLGVAAAYELTKAPKDKQEEIVTRAEAARLKALEREEAEEARALKAAEKEAKSAETEAEKQARLELAEAAAKTAAQELADAKAALKAAQHDAAKTAKAPANFLELPKDEQKQIAEAAKAAKTNVREAEKLVGKLLKAEDKAKRALKALTEPKAAKAETPSETAKKTATKKAKVEAPITPAEVKSAKKAAGVKSKGPVPLTLAEVRESLDALEGSEHDGVSAIASVLSKMVGGEYAVEQAEKGLLEVLAATSGPEEDIDDDEA